MAALARLAFAALMLLLAGVPFAVLFGNHLARSSWESVALESGRFFSPLASTVSLMALVVLIAVPAGVVQALALRCAGVLGRRWLGVGVLAGLFVPLPVWAVSWQIALGEWLPPVALEPGEVAWRPWNLGLLPAAWIHAVAAWPWVVAIVWIALQTSDPALEDEALQTGGRRGAFLWVTLPKLAWAVLAAAAAVALQAGTEIAITDAMMVRTFAEEVYTQMVIRSAGLDGAIAATVPVWLGSALVLGLVVRFGSKRFLASGSQIRYAPPPRVPTSHLRTALAWLPVGTYLGLPLGALLWKAAGGGRMRADPLGELGRRIEKVVRTEWLTLLDSLAAAAVAGACTALLAWCACALAIGAPRYRAGLFASGLLLVAMPGPLVGSAIKEATVTLVVAERSALESLELRPDFPPLKSMLYDQPSPIPGIWASALRFFPLACGMMAVAMQRIPKPLLETAAVEGEGPSTSLRLVIAPITGRAFLIVAAAMAALTFGEVSAGKLAQPPSRGVFILRLFDQMHYGAESTVAALCLLQLAGTLAILALLCASVRDRNG